MKIKKFCLRERNRFLKNLVYNQESMTGCILHCVLYPLLYSIVFRSKKKRKEKFPRFTGLHYLVIDTGIYVVKPKPLIQKKKGNPVRLIEIDNDRDNNQNDDNTDNDNDTDNNNDEDNDDDNNTESMLRHVS